MTDALKNEFEGFITLEFYDVKDAHRFITIYEDYEKKQDQKHVRELLPNISNDVDQIFSYFEYITMKKEPLQLMIDYKDNKAIIKLWIVCQLHSVHFKNDQKENKSFIVDKIRQYFVKEFDNEYQCESFLEYLDVAADNVEE